MLLQFKIVLRNLFDITDSHHTLLSSSMRLLSCLAMQAQISHAWVTLVFHHNDLYKKIFEARNYSHKNEV